MKSIWTKIYTLFSLIKDNFIFFPSLIIILILLAGLILISIDGAAASTFIKNIPYIMIHELDTVRSILSGFLTGLISITVFSFSMVMLVLNQASVNYSPRILNWMVGEKGNQYTLGVYLGTILLTILLLLQLPEDEKALPSFHFAVLLDAILTFYCLILFVKFINRVSKDIQITNITQNIFKKTCKKLKEEAAKSKKPLSHSEIENYIWHSYSSSYEGYLQKVAEKELVKVLAKHNLVLKILHKFGFYYLKAQPLYALSKEVKDKEILSEIESTFIFYPGERIEDQAFYGFRQLSEIAVKALSPGINDPGTAHQCIDYLTHLFLIKMECERSPAIQDKEGNDRIFIEPHPVSHLIKSCLIPVLQYGGKDVRVLENLLALVKQLASNDSSRKYQKELNDFLKGAIIFIEQHKENSYLYNHLGALKRQTLRDLNSYFSGR